ncbi:hypothetical protein B0H11DRAFT_1901526 [Mycena galericulata]|nr:hypothetical protein B0H11DRAFT_1901526 [Mycena galericulata]
MYYTNGDRIDNVEANKMTGTIPPTKRTGPHLRSSTASPTAPKSTSGRLDGAPPYHAADPLEVLFLILVNGSPKPSLSGIAEGVDKEKSELEDGESRRSQERRRLDGICLILALDALEEEESRRGLL